ncbi:MAG: NTP transferase domain-containing protein, partial [Xanthomonadales bacterium]|nr:NTP transferase domain-containing protein [Xanthomonadales bacterium]NIX11987.1 NTP transferase domain-containing protein [Xanthomonadales bacterium]
MRDLAQGNVHAKGYPEPIDAIVLSGTHTNPRRLIGDRNKAFLKVGGRALVRHVVDALLGAETIAEIFVVGPVEKLGGALQGVSARVRTVQQEGKMLSNTWAAIYASEGRHSDEDPHLVHRRPLLIISCDLPLISAGAIDDFVERCAAEDRMADEPYAMLTGVVDEPGVAPFYPRDGETGIERPFVEASFGRLRLANIYVARPRQLAHQEFLQTGFSYRKAKDWRNVLALTLRLLTQHGGWAAAWLSVRMQFTLWARRYNWHRMYRWLRRGNTQERMERCTGAVLGGSIRVVVTPFGGLSLDVDEEEDYRILSEKYED